MKTPAFRRGFLFCTSGLVLRNWPMTCRAAALLLLVTLAAPLRGQPGQTDTLATGQPSFWNRTWQGTLTAFTAPEMRRYWAITAVAAVAASPFDDWATGPDVRSKLLPAAWARFGDLWGAPTAALIILPTVAVAEYVRGSNGPVIRERMTLVASSLVAVGLMTVIIKELTRRTRPNGTDHRSFPSGHTSISFGVAEVVRELYGNLAGLPFYLLAVNTGLSRIHDNKHYPSDVVAGAGLGIGLVRSFRLSGRSRHGLALSWQPVPGGALLQVTFRQ